MPRRVNLSRLDYREAIQESLEDRLPLCACEVRAEAVVDSETE